MAPKVTLQTIADAIGVSRTTVSNAYCRPDQLSDDLRERIFEAAARLGYRGPNPVGRSLRSGRAGAVGVVLTESLPWAFADPYAVEFLAALAGVAESARHALLLVPCPPGEDQSEGVRNAVVDGFCVFTLPDEHPIVEEVLCRQLPTVFVDGPLIEGTPSSVSMIARRWPTSPATCWASAIAVWVCLLSGSGPTVGSAPRRGTHRLG